MKDLIIAGQHFQSRLLLGTGKFSSKKTMAEAIEASGTQMVTVALKRVDVAKKEEDLGNYLKLLPIQLLPNTSGARNAKEAILAAQLGREALETNWLKLEIHPDPRYLFPDPIETLAAAETLVKLGFIVLPYINADAVLCKRLEDVGTAAVMPLGAPIGSNKGLQTKDMLEIIIRESKVPVIIDAGIGAPSHAAAALEMGADAVLVNTAIAVAQHPVNMAIAFKLGVEAGRIAYESKLGIASEFATASSPLTAFLEE
ncbi:MAG: thiazole synthase [Chitinophagaceae bacterium]|nr:thiazole synthase [Chitinophagaceae bacterium]